MAETKGNGGGEGLSLQTLVVAAAASAVAAIVVSPLWKDGTVIAAAMTPVIVTIVKEMLQRPMESELVRKPVQQVGRIASGRLVTPGRPRGTGDPVVPRDPVVPPTEQHDGGPGNGAGSARPGELSQMRTYGRTRRRPPH